LRWLGSWQFLLLTTVGLLSGAIAFAAISLFRIPNLPNCRAIFWPTASAALRLQCAESYAAQNRVESLLAAIDLVNRLPATHPLRAEIDARIEEWASQILTLADETFNQGKLEEAIATVEKIPVNTTAAQLVQDRIQRWQKIWQTATDIFEAAKQKLIERKFPEAFSLSVKLLDVGNDYWAETKYAELTKLISLAREDSAKLTKAEQLARRATVEGFQEALKLLDTISADSILHSEAQKAKQEMAEDMLQIAEAALDRQNLSQAEKMLAAIPRNAGFDQKVADFQVFVDAYQRAWSDDVAGLDAAITRLQSLGQDRPLYGRAQQLISRWRSEIQAMGQLNQARSLAESGNISDLTAAIAEAQKISRSNPRWQEASRQIRRWRARIETTEDRPILTQAEQLAAPGTPDALRAAIQEARKVSSGRALSDDARTQIRGWERQIESIEDRPLLDQARSLANRGDLSSAIATAGQIGSGRALYAEAQRDISRWRSQNQSRQWLQDAYSAAAAGTGNGLANAIAIAGRIPSNSAQYSEAVSQINRWSWQLLNQAEAAARRDLNQAINFADAIPSQSEAYTAAQTRIRAWKAEQQPPIAPAPASEPTAAPDTPGSNSPDSSDAEPSP
jgi:hypothetical protein